MVLRAENENLRVQLNQPMAARLAQNDGVMEPAAEAPDAPRQPGLGDAAMRARNGGKPATDPFATGGKRPGGAMMDPVLARRYAATQPPATNPVPVAAE